MRAAMRHMLVLLVVSATAVPVVRAQFPPEIRGQVIDPWTGVGVPGAEVSLSDGPQTTTNADGTFVLRALRPGPADLAVRRIGYARFHRSLELANGRVETIVLTLTPKAVALPELTTAAERAGANVSTIDRTRIERSSAADLGDILQGEAGAVITRRGGPASPATISLRGSSTDQVLVLVDGVPVNDPLTGEADLSLIPLSAVERITVLRGAQSARYGPRALGGVIAVETRRAASGQMQATIGAGRWGTRHGGARVMAGGRGETQLSVTLGGEWRSFGGHFPVNLPVERGGGRGVRDNADADVVTLDGTASFETPSLGARVHADFFDVERGMPGTVVQPSLSARQSQRRVDIGAETRWRRASWLTTLGITAQRQDGTFADSTPPFSAPYDHRARAHTLLGTATVTGRAGRSDLSVGVEARRITVEGTALATDSRRALEFAGLWTTFRSPSMRRGLWYLDVGTSVRVDAATLTRGAVISPQLSLTARRHRLSTEVRWARAYNPPSLADLFFQEGVQVQPNPNLGAERVNSEWTAAVTMRDVGVGPFRGEFSTAAYVADVDGMIVWSPDFRYVWSPGNFNVRRRGAELSARLVPRTTGITLAGSAALTDVQYAGPIFEGQVLYRPRWTAAMSAEATQFGFDGRLGYRFTGHRPTAIGTSLNELSPVHLLDLTLARELPIGRARLRMRGTVENLLDTRAGMLIDYPFPGRLLRAEMTFFHPLGDM